MDIGYLLSSNPKNMFFKDSIRDKYSQVAN